MSAVLEWIASPITKPIKEGVQAANGQVGAVAAHGEAAIEYANATVHQAGTKVQDVGNAAQNFIEDPKVREAVEEGAHQIEQTAEETGESIGNFLSNTSTALKAFVSSNLLGIVITKSMAALHDRRIMNMASAVAKSVEKGARAQAEIVAFQEAGIVEGGVGRYIYGLLLSMATKYGYKTTFIVYYHASSIKHLLHEAAKADGGPTISYIFRSDWDNVWIEAARMHKRRLAAGDQNGQTHIIAPSFIPRAVVWLQPVVDVGDVTIHGLKGEYGPNLTLITTHHIGCTISGIKTDDVRYVGRGEHDPEAYSTLDNVAYAAGCTLGVVTLPVSLPYLAYREYKGEPVETVEEGKARDREKVINEARQRFEKEHLI